MATNAIGNMVKNPGFTLIEVLVVAIIIGILSAIALPSFLNQANKARQSEGKMLVSSHNRAQSAYRLENGQFALNPKLLGIGLGSTKNYIFTVEALDRNTIVNLANSRWENLISYAGAVNTALLKDGVEQAVTLSIICESLGYEKVSKVNIKVIDNAATENEALQCAGNTQKL